MKTKFVKILILSFSIFFSVNIYSQEIPINKKTLLKKFKESKKDFQLKDVWLICNKDSSFYKNDTFWIYNHTNYFYHSNCCEFIEWDFFRNRKFVQFETWMCEEPPTSTIPNIKNAYKVYVKKKNEKLFLITKNNLHKREYEILKMEIVELWEKGDKSFRMKLVKNKNWH